MYARCYDCCVKNCMAFTGEHWLRRRCAHCESQFLWRGNFRSSDNLDFFVADSDFASLTAEASYSYVPLIPRLKLLSANREWAKNMRYPTEVLAKEWGSNDDDGDVDVDAEPNDDVRGGVRDVWEGRRMKDLRARGTQYFLWLD
jgi:hypothetical protein